MQDVIEGYLQRFSARAGRGDVPFAFRHDGGEHGLHVLFSVCIHGDEVGPLPAAVRMVDALAEGRVRYGGRCTVIVGNVDAVRAGRRFVEADLNRVFLDGVADSIEARRAAALMPLLDTVDVHLDFHQTMEPSARPFYMSPFFEHCWHWARALRASSTWITRAPSMGFAPGMKCIDEYVRDRGRPGLTVELGRRGLSEDAARRAWSTMVGALWLADAISEGRTTIADEAAAQPDLQFFETFHRIDFPAPEWALRPGFRNFERVRKGDGLHAQGAPSLVAEHDGWLVFPKYPDRIDGRVVGPLPKHIAQLVRPMASHPREMW